MFSPHTDPSGSSLCAGDGNALAVGTAAAAFRKVAAYHEAFAYLYPRKVNIDEPDQAQVHRHRIPLC